MSNVEGGHTEVFLSISSAFSLPFSHFVYAILIMVFGVLKQGMENAIR